MPQSRLVKLIRFNLLFVFHFLQKLTGEPEESKPFFFLCLPDVMNDFGTGQPVGIRKGGKNQGIFIHLAVQGMIDFIRMDMTDDFPLLELGTGV